MNTLKKPKRTRWKRVFMPTIGQRYFHENFGFYRIKKIWSCEVFSAHCVQPGGSQWFNKKKAAIVTEDGLKYTVPYFELVYCSIDESGKFVLPR